MDKSHRTPRTMTLIPGGQVTTEKVVLSNMIFDEALVWLVVRKGLVTETEIVAKIQTVQKEMEKRCKGRQQEKQ